MPDEGRFSGTRREEIEGAPPVASSAEYREKRLNEQTTLNRYLYQQTLQFEHMLLSSRELQDLLETLLVNLPRHYGFSSAELWLHDPDNALVGLIVGGERYGHSLQLLPDVFEMQELYPLEPDIQLIDAKDARMFEVLTTEQGIDLALLLPLMEEGRLAGSLHVGLREDSLAFGEEEEGLFAHLAVMVSRCLSLAVHHQQISQLIMLDPLTKIGNVRGFERDTTREISRARRSGDSFSLLMMDVDEYDELHEHYGEVRGHFVLKKVTERISSNLRATDYMARLSRSRLAVLLPGCGESFGQDIAERMRRDIEDFSIDDGRGAVLQVTLSVGLVTWEPQQYPAVDMGQLARQMESVSLKALAESRARGGNTSSISRLSTLLV